MKQIILSFSFMLVSSILGIKVYAHSFAQNNSDGITIYYSFNYNKTEVGVSYLGDSYDVYSDRYTGNVVIPESVTYNGKTYSVKFIGNYAFKGCTGLTSVTIPNSVTDIYSYAFEDCSGLASIIVDAGNKEYDSRDNCNAIIHTASNTLIAGCKNTTIPSSIMSIGDHAFYGCSGLTSVTIPNSVTRIGNYAFYNCSGLTSITIPNSVTYISNAAFWGCDGLTSMIVESGNSIYDSRNNCNAIIYTRNNSLFIGCKNTIIPNSVTTIGSTAFQDCTGLTGITIPNSVTSIGNDAFMHCSGLTSITIPNSVTSVGERAFYGCRGLTSVTIPGNVTSVGKYAFYDCTNLTSVELQGSPTFGSSVFSNCPIKEATFDCETVPPLFSGFTTLEKIKMTESVISISAGSFRGCSGLTSITIPKSVTSVGQSAFYDTRLSYLELQCSLTAVNRGAFGSLKEVKLDCEKVTSLLSNSSVEKITMTNNVKSIDAGAFSFCQCLSSVTIPNSVTSIGERTFEYCRSLSSVTIPNSVTSIDASAFVNCRNLSSITIPNSVTSIGPAAFAACPNLATIIVEEGNTVYDSRNNCNAIIETASNSLIAGCKNTIIPNSVTTIFYATFAGCMTLTSVTIPNSVTTIIDDAFNSTGLTSITIPKSVTSIGNTAFAYCTQLTDVFCYAEEVPSTPSNAFEASSLSGATLHVPATAVKAYSEASPWSGFNSIVPIEELEPCATPTIAFKNGKVMFSCETEGVDFVYEITNVDVQNGSGAEVSLGTTYHISVYATKEGYENSEIATADIDARGIVGDLSGDGNVDATDLTRLIDIILKKKQ